jgi:hypothetical protein
VDLIVLGEIAAQPMLDPDSGIAGQVLGSLTVTEVIKGNFTDRSLLVDVGAAVMTTGKRLARVSASGLDPCDGGKVLLFLEPSDASDLFRISSQGWARVSAARVQDEAVTGLFSSHADESSLLAVVRDTVTLQEAQDIPKGLLLCESRRLSEFFADPVVCAGESFNPYEAFRLEPSRGAHIETTDPGPEPYVLSRSDLAPGSPKLAELMSSLDTDVTLEPTTLLLDGPKDMISVTFITEYATKDRRDFSFWYSPSQGIVQVPVSVAQFQAPQAFRAAMESFLAEPSVVEQD